MHFVDVVVCPETPICTGMKGLPGRIYGETKMYRNEKGSPHGLAGIVVGANR
jgi:hypothetical protein